MNKNLKTGLVLVGLVALIVTVILCVSYKGQRDLFKTDYEKKSDSLKIVAAELQTIIKIHDSLVKEKVEAANTKEIELHSQIIKDSSTLSTYKKQANDKILSIPNLSDDSLTRAMSKG